MELLQDIKFNNGFNLKGLNSIRDGHKTIKIFRLTDQSPQWYLCQWNSKYNLTEGTFSIRDGGYEISDESKSLTVSDGELVFELNADREYDAPRLEHEPWPHILIEQEIDENNAVRDLKKIECSAKFMLESLENHMNGCEREYHTAQFVWVVTLKDVNPQSPSFNSFMWVVLCPFDSRYDFAPLFTQQDMALPNGNFIYSFAGKDFMDKPLRVGEESTLRFDIYPHLDDMLVCAQKYGFMKGSKKDDLVVNSTNMGFEITGTYNCKIRVRDMTISAERK